MLTSVVGIALFCCFTTLLQLTDEQHTIGVEWTVLVHLHEQNTAATAKQKMDNALEGMSRQCTLMHPSVDGPLQLSIACHIKKLHTVRKAAHIVCQHG